MGEVVMCNTMILYRTCKKISEIVQETIFPLSGPDASKFTESCL